MDWLNQFFGLFRSFQFWITIAPWESGLVVRLGKHARVLTPGIHLRIPFMDRIFLQPTRLRTIVSMGQTSTTRDGKSLTINIAVSYAIADIAKLYLSVSNPEETLICNAQAHVGDYVSGVDSVGLTSLMIEEAVNAKLAAIDWGLDQVALKITTFAFAKPIRLLNCDWRVLSSADNL